MKRFLHFLTGSLLVGALLILGACGGGGGAQAPASSAGTKLEIGSDGENMAFKPATLTAKANQQVTVAFKNNASGLQHNWVLVKGGEDVAAEIDKAGIAAGPDKFYLPDDKSKIVASSKLLNPGQSEEVAFTAPAAGTYLFICTVPGHYQLGMKGTLTFSS